MSLLARDGDSGLAPSPCIGAGKPLDTTGGSPGSVGLQSTLAANHWEGGTRHAVGCSARALHFDGVPAANTVPRCACEGVCDEAPMPAGATSAALLAVAPSGPSPPPPPPCSPLRRAPESCGKVERSCAASSSADCAAAACAAAPRGGRDRTSEAGHTTLAAATAAARSRREETLEGPPASCSPSGLLVAPLGSEGTAGEMAPMEEATHEARGAVGSS